jgi:hypothetical protein
MMKKNNNLILHILDYNFYGFIELSILAASSFPFLADSVNHIIASSFFLISTSAYNMEANSY